MSDETPQGWVETPLETLAASTKYPIGDGDHGQIKPATYTDKGVPYIRVADMGWGKFEPNGLVHIPEEVHEQNLKSELLPGDVLIAKTGATIGKCCIVPDSIPRANTTSSVGKVTINRDVTSPEWILYYFLTRDFKEQMWAVSEKTAQPGFNIRDLKQFRILLAPLAEQRRIVAKLERLLGKVDACQLGLAKIPVLLKRFRQSVLAAACSGRLTADWRDEAETENLNPSVPANPEGLADVEAIVDTPDHWRWLPLQALCDRTRAICYGVIKLGAEFPNGIPCLRTSDVKPLHLDTSGVKRIAPDISNKYRRTLLRGGEVLVTVRGTLGGVATVPVELRDWNISREVALVPLADVVAKFIAFWIAAIACQKWLTGVTKGVAYTGINIEDLRMLPVALPSIAEQKEIVRRVGALFALADRIEARFAKANVQVDKLAASLLAKAFRGELVPTEAELARREARDYEGAQALLERLSARNDRANPAHLSRKPWRRRTAPKRSR